MNYSIENELKDALLNFSTEHENFDLPHETRMVMYRFLSEIERLLDEHNLNRKELSQKIGTSASFLTQLFRGNKILNLETVAKFQNVFDVIFEIKAKPAKEARYGLPVNSNSLDLTDGKNEYSEQSVSGKASTMYVVNSCVNKAA
jgi:transcriptional regulator with XRE-family HTH domain